MKEKVVVFLIFILSFLILFSTFNTQKSELEEKREEVELYNYNMEVKKNLLELAMNTAVENSYDVLNYLKGEQDNLTFLNESQLSDVDYLKYIIEVTRDNETSFEILNYQFYDDTNDNIVDYYLFNGMKPVVLELIYSSNSVVDTKIY